ncbi:efflux transporter outer membrane subunit [Novosphingobium bradum]|uniref:Efflux transporter outer membrane subunit n=1 Tax=Novosphingobium bradum TaxID=1737444 RepID=A0ABV7INN1_9SPHN
MRRAVPFVLAPVLAPVLALALAGCSLAPKYVREARPVPDSWPVGDAYLARTEAALPVVSYREVFTDARLQALVGQALANNSDLRVAAANLAAARARVDVQRGAQLPQVGVGAGATRRSTEAGGPVTAWTASGGISAFELDLFGRLANATRAEQETALASEASARTVRLGLVADLANAWADHAADAELLRIAQQTAVAARRSVALNRALLRGGVAARSDVGQAEQVLATAEADLAAQTTALAQDRNLVELLVGAPVDPALLPGDLASVGASVRSVPAGTSSDVLLRRPDVIAAEYRLRAANADVGVARAELFPRLSLTALVGLAANSFEGLFKPGALTSTLGGNAGYALFSGGSARANVRVSQAQRETALATWEKAVQTAFREVADALARQGTMADELAAVERRTAAAADTALLVEARYRGGVASSLESLDAQRSLYTAQRAEVASRLASVRSRITLYRVLGGDQLAPGTP